MLNRDATDQPGFPVGMPLDNEGYQTPITAEIARVSGIELREMTPEELAHAAGTLGQSGKEEAIVDIALRDKIVAVMQAKKIDSGSFSAALEKKGFKLVENPSAYDVLKSALYLELQKDDRDETSANID